MASFGQSSVFWNVMGLSFWKAVNAEKGRIKPESNLPTAQPAAKGMLTGLCIWALRCSASGSIQLETASFQFPEMQRERAAKCLIKLVT